MNTIYYIILMACLAQCSKTAKILVVFPMPSYSHFYPGKVLFDELISRGHELTIINPYPQEKPQKYKDIGLPGIREEFFASLGDLDMFGEYSVYRQIMDFQRAGVAISEYIFQRKGVQDLINSDEQFDLIILDTLASEAIYGFCHRFKAPYMAMSMVSSSIWANRLTGNIGLSSYVAEIMSDFSPRMTFWERFRNLSYGILQELMFHFYSGPKQNQIIQQNFPGAPHLYDLMYNTSFIIMNSHPGLSAPVSLVPNMVELAGFHIKNDVSLPADVQKFLDDHKEGVIYFSFGTNVESSDMPTEQLRSITQALRQWKKPILWKFAGDKTPVDLPNVRFSKWLPQQAVLAHKNVKAFISHMGRLSSIESIYFGVPLLGIPLFGEQSFNAAQMVHAGYGIALDFKTLDEEQLYKALVEITSNPKYSERAKVISESMRSRPLSALDEAVYWVEYIMKFKGAPHLRNAGVDLPWYQFWMADIMALLLLMITFIGILMYSLLRICCVSGSSKGRKSKKE